MNRYFLTPLAESDLNAIHDYIAADDHRVALKVTTQLQDACEKLAKMPLMGRARNELAVGWRSFPVARYIIFYRVFEGDIQIMRILHGAQDIDSILSSDP